MVTTQISMWDAIAKSANLHNELVSRVYKYHFNEEGNSNLTVDEISNIIADAIQSINRNILPNHGFYVTRSMILEAKDLLIFFPASIIIDMLIVISKSLINKLKFGITMDDIKELLFEEVMEYPEYCAIILDRARTHILEQ